MANNLLKEKLHESDTIDPENYKGIYYEEADNSEKYFDSVTGAHFKYEDIWGRLSKLANDHIKENRATPVLKIRKGKIRHIVKKQKTKIKGI